MTEMDELKPCPFCGYAPTGEEELLDILDVDEFGEKVEKIKYVGVSCAGCCAYVPVQTHDKTEAIAAWNRRAALEAAAKVQPSAASDGWQDISTAPKDGTMILLFNAAHDEQAVMGWTDDVGLPDVFPDGCWTNVGSRSASAAISLMVYGGYFQYWRPLPASPAEAKGDA